MEPQHHRGHGGGGGGSRQYYYYADEDDDFSAEELFNIFFGHSGKSSECQLFFSKIIKHEFILGVATRGHRRRQQGHTYHFTNNTTQNVCLSIYRIKF